MYPSYTYPYSPSGINYGPYSYSPHYLPSNENLTISLPPPPSPLEIRNKDLLSPLSFNLSSLSHSPPYYINPTEENNLKEEQQEEPEYFISNSTTDIRLYLTQLLFSALPLSSSSNLSLNNIMKVVFQNPLATTEWTEFIIREFLLHKGLPFIYSTWFVLLEKEEEGKQTNNSSILILKEDFESLIELLHLCISHNLQQVISSYRESFSLEEGEVWISTLNYYLHLYEYKNTSLEDKKTRCIIEHLEAIRFTNKTEIRLTCSCPKEKKEKEEKEEVQEEKKNKKEIEPLCYTCMTETIYSASYEMCVDWDKHMTFEILIEKVEESKIMETNLLPLTFNFIKAKQEACSNPVFISEFYKVPYGHPFHLMSLDPQTRKYKNKDLFCSLFKCGPFDPFQEICSNSLTSNKDHYFVQISIPNAREFCGFIINRRTNYKFPDLLSFMGISNVEYSYIFSEPKDNPWSTLYLYATQPEYIYVFLKLVDWVIKCVQTTRRYEDGFEEYARNLMKEYKIKYKNV